MNRRKSVKSVFVRVQFLSNFLINTQVKVDMRCRYFIAAFLAMALNLACQTVSVTSIPEVNLNSNAAVQQTKEIYKHKVSLNPIKVVQPIKAKDKRKLDAMVNNLIQNKNRYDEKSIKELTADVDNNPLNKTYVAKKVLDKVIQICNDENSTKSIDDMKVLGTMSNILADFQTVEALDVLIECSDRNGPYGGESFYNNETVPAIVEYQEKAYPYLERKLLSSDINSEIKCTIVSILVQKAGLEGKKILMNARKIETKQMAKYCIEKALK